MRCYQSGKNSRSQIPETRKAPEGEHALRHGFPLEALSHRELVPVLMGRNGRHWILMPMAFNSELLPAAKAPPFKRGDLEVGHHSKAKAKLQVLTILLWIKVIFTYHN